jgi:hypothetical protein
VCRRGRGSEVLACRALVGRSLNLRHALFAVLCLSRATETFAGAFEDDRQYGNSPVFVTARVYTGRVATRRCFEMTIEQCSTLAAVPESLKCQARNDGMQICYGQKKLYRGTGTANSSIGPEWREFQLRDGKVMGEWAVVQIVETMALGASPDTAQRYCEDFGARGINPWGQFPCNGVEPFGTLPSLPRDGPKFSRAYSPDELSQIAMTVQVMQGCLQSVPSLRGRGAPVYARWRQVRADVVGFMESALASEIAKNVAGALANGADAQQRQQCGGYVTMLDRQSRAVNAQVQDAGINLCGVQSRVNVPTAWGAKWCS